MKSEVIEFFQNLPDSEPEQFNKAFELYRRSPNKNLASERAYNSGGYSDYALGNLLYDLQQLHGVTDLEKLPELALVQYHELTVNDKLKIAIIGADPVIKTHLMHGLKLAAEYPDMEMDKVSPVVREFVETLTDQCENFLEEFMKNEGIKELFPILEILPLMADEIAATVFPDNILKEFTASADNSEELQDQEVKKLDDNPDLTAANINISDVEILDSKGDKVNKSESETLKLRDQYPFLKDDDCPAELKILVSDKLTVLDNYKDCHQRLKDIKDGKLVVSPEEEKELAAAAVGWFEDNEEITAELDYYKEHKDILGKHRIFSSLALQRKVDAMTPKQLNNFVTQTPSYMSKKNTALKTATEEEKHEINKKITERNEMLALVQKKLGINAG
ncbi:hypothetical protein ACX0HA_08945 [Flavobacterium hauense]